MNLHNYDVWQIYYKAIKQGRKTFHILKYLDVQVGDEIIFHEITPEKQYTGNQIACIVTYVHKGSDMLDGRILACFKIMPQNFDRTILVNEAINRITESRNGEDLDWLVADYLNKTAEIEVLKTYIEKFRGRLDWVIGKTTDKVTKSKLESIAQEMHDIIHVGVTDDQLIKSFPKDGNI